MLSTEFEEEWLACRAKVKKVFGQAPDLNGMLFLIGVQESDQQKNDFTKEEKRDLMHVAVCKLLEPLGFYRYVGKDDEGWPHFEVTEQLPTLNLKEQENLLRRQIVKYFETRL